MRLNLTLGALLLACSAYGQSAPDSPRLKKLRSYAQGEAGAAAFGRAADGSNVVGLPPNPAVSASPAQAVPRPAAPRVELSGVVRFVPSGADGERERLFLERVLEKLQQSPEGRSILQGLADERRAARSPVPIELVDFPGSAVVRERGIEDIAGGPRGESLYDPPRYQLNRRFLDFSDPDAAAIAAAANAGHELEHLRSLAEIERKAPGLGGVWQVDMRNEEDARIEGWIVADELSPGKPNLYTAQTRAFLASPDGYWSFLRGEYFYAGSLDGPELPDPIAALRDHLLRLRSRLAADQATLARVPEMLEAVRHFKEVHRLLGLDDIEEILRGDQASLPGEIQAVAAKVKELEGMLAYVSSPQGAPWIEKVKSAASDPAYQAEVSRVEDGSRRLFAETQNRPLPPAPSRAGQLTFAEFGKLVENDKKDHPEHWKK